MYFYMDRIESELKRIMRFWEKNALSSPPTYMEVFTQNTSNNISQINNVYISGIIYSCSVLTRFLRNDLPLNIVQFAYSQQQLSLSNPYGGYYYGCNSDGSTIHQSHSITHAHAYVVLGLTEYFKTTKSQTLLTELKTTVDFIEDNLSDKDYGGYLEGFTLNWQPEIIQKKKLNTHIRIMEAYANYYQLTSDNNILTKLEEIIGLVICQFFNDKKLNLQYEFLNNWSKPNDTIKIGITAETSWLLFHCAKITRNASLIEQSAHIAVQLTGLIMEYAYDKQYGGVFSELTHYHTPVNTHKEWWVQTEATLAFLNSYEITSDKTYLTYATRLFEYIDNTFSDTLNDEWLNSVTREGNPILSSNTIYNTKSLHHIVRFGVEGYKRFRHIAQSKVVL